MAWKQGAAGIWQRDAAVIEVVQHFDEPSRKNQWEKITSKESKIILGELDHCRQDFSYAARNYFWIVNKAGEDIPFRLWESQELILEKWYWLREKYPNRAQKMMILKARQLGALDPFTLVLCADFQWRFLMNLSPGDVVFSVDEFPIDGKGDVRRLRAATILKKWEVRKEAFRITLKSGTQIVASDDHPFLSQDRGSVVGNWVEVSKLRVGDAIFKFRDLWSDAEVGEAWMGSILYGKWDKVVSIESVGLQDLVDIETTTGTFIAEGLVTHNCSTVIEGLIAWATIFFSNRNALVVSHNDAHAAYLYSIMLHIYDMLPWWLKPMCSSRKQEAGLYLANPDLDARRENPGNNSLISVQSASQLSGVGQGMKLNAVHCCFAPETLFRMADGDILPLDRIGVGDLIVTSTGEIAPVKKVWPSDRRNEPTAKLWMWGSPYPQETTTDHGVLTGRGKVAAGSLVEGDEVLIPLRAISNNGKIVPGTEWEPTANIGWIVGYFAANGNIRVTSSTDRVSGIRFGCHRDRGDYVIGRIRDVLGEGHHLLVRERGKGLVIDAYNSVIGRWFNLYIGRKDSKRLPSWCWDMGRDFCMGVVRGYLEGDGDIKKGVNWIGVKSVRPALIYQLQLLLASLGYGWIQIKYRQGGCLYGRNWRDIWEGTICGKSARRLRQDMGWPFIDRLSNKYRDGWRYLDSGDLALEVVKAEVGFREEFLDIEIDHLSHCLMTCNSFVFNSEYADWGADKFRDIIDGDMVHAIADNIHSFAFLESTGKGSGSPSEEMWVAQNELIELGEEAEWTPLFIPWFFEKTRVWPPEQGWTVQQPELDMRRKVSHDWVECDNAECSQYFESQFRHMSRVDTKCLECKVGYLRSVILTDEQLRFMQNRRINAQKKGPDSEKRLREELATTAEEAFQLTGIQVFPPSCQEFVNMCVDRSPLIWGNIDGHGRIHYVLNPRVEDGNPSDPDQPCGVDGCLMNHRWDPEHPLQVWETVDPQALYCIGADVAEGLSGRADFSVAFVNKYYENGRGPDEQVAMWRSNTVDPIEFAGVLNALGRYYNTALIAVEVNKYDSCDMALRMHHMYPNPFVWKHYDSKNPISQKLGWFTNQRTKSMLWQTAVRWIKSRMWIIKSEVFANEMKRFQKDDYDSISASAERNFHDDVIIAGMIALFCAHDMDYGEGFEYIPTKENSSLVSVGDWTNECSVCRKSWNSAEMPSRKCPSCRSMLVSCHRNTGTGLKTAFDIEELGKTQDQLAEERGEKIRTEFDADDSFATI